MDIKNCNIKKKILFSFIIPIELFFLTIVIFVSGVFFIQGNFSDFYNYAYELSRNTQNSCTAVQGAAKSVAVSMSLSDAKMIQSFQDNAAEYMDTLESNLEDFLEIYDDDKTEIKKNLNKIKESDVVDYGVQIEETLRLIEEAKEYRQAIEEVMIAGKPEEALTLYITKYGPKMTAIQTNIQNLDVAVGKIADTTFFSSRTSSTWILLVSLIVSAVSLIVTVGMAKKLITNLTQPIKEIEKAAKEMTEGNFSVTINYESEDELGSLVRSMNILCDDVKEIIEDIARILSELSEGKFKATSSCIHQYTKDYIPILTAMRAIRDNLSETLRNIDESAEQVACGSAQLADNAQMLAEGATEQASAVEELTAMITDVFHMSEKNAEDAQVAYERMREAEIQADKGKQNLQDLTNAMNVIQETSMQIQNIIASIEDIASQTNLLALNASIEAARAGDAGRGFAVVADQIGKLATDSARSAIDTKQLIEKSIGDIKSGTNITEKTVQAIQEILISMSEFGTIAKVTSDTSKTQANMLEQIQQGIEQISNTVESNSASAEETSATSQELFAQAENLKNQVQKFELADRR